MKNYIQLMKKEINEKSSAIVIDNSDITKPCSKKMEALSNVRDGNTGEIKKVAGIIKTNARFGDKYVSDKYNAIIVAVKDAEIFGHALKSNAVRIRLYIETYKEQVIELRYQKQILRDENRSLRDKLEKVYEFMKQFVIGGINLLEKFME